MMQRHPGGASYTCWKCLLRARSPLVARLRGVRKPTPPFLLQSFHSASRRLANTFYKDNFGEDRQLDLQILLSPSDGRDIRERLREWEAGRGAWNYDALQPDLGYTDSVSNLRTRGETVENSEIRVPDSGALAGRPRAVRQTEIPGEDLIATQVAEAGDLVEIRLPSSRLPVLGVYLGFFGGFHHFYNAPGQWRYTPTYKSYFSVPAFVDRSELGPIIDQLPRPGSAEVYRAMDRERRGPSRESGAGVLEKLSRFSLESQRIMQVNVRRLDAVLDVIPDQQQPRYLTLFEVTRELFPERSGITPELLYAVHLSLFRDDGAFRPVSADTVSHRRDYLFEAAPAVRMRILRRVETMTRQLVETMARSSELRLDMKKLLQESPLYGFIVKARRVVLQHRQVRRPTTHGVLGPSGPPAYRETVDWTADHLQVLFFLERWAAVRQFTNSSTLNSIGSSILRMTGLFSSSEDLTATAAWTLLQELGWIPHWELTTRYRISLPGTSVSEGKPVRRHLLPGLRDSLRHDVAAGHREDWTSDPVFCIDAASTTVIDDGISLGRADKPDEFWINVHVADPTSVIKPDSNLSRYAELMPLNIYLPGFNESMLPLAEADEGDSPGEASAEAATESLGDRFSLANGRPCLTFSARVNEGGDILETKIRPGVLRSVVYLDTPDVAAFCGDEPARVPSQLRFAVGKRPVDSERDGRDMTATQDLDPAARDSLLTLSRLCGALRKRRVDAGGLASSMSPSPTVSVSFHDVRRSHDGAAPLPALGDPYIEISYDALQAASVVTESMILAGHVAARWCHARGVPIPFRRETDAERNAETIIRLSRERIRPQLEAGVPLTSGDRRQLSVLAGSVENSTRSGPFVIMGLDMYTRVTSPLRRFGDMLVHWQLHAALALERELGRTLTPADVAYPAPETGSWRGPTTKTAVTHGNGDNYPLPLTQAALDTILPPLTMRERMVRDISRGCDEWILQALVRAWRFPEQQDDGKEQKQKRDDDGGKKKNKNASNVSGARPTSRLPDTFRFVVRSVSQAVVTGELNWFGRLASMRLEGLDGVVRIADVEEGDVFEVVLMDVNVHTQTILVKALKRLEGGAKGGQNSKGQNSGGKNKGEKKLTHGGGRQNEGQKEGQNKQQQKKGQEKGKNKKEQRKKEQEKREENGTLMAE